MLFNSLHFAVFFAVVWTAGLALRRRVTARNALLLTASYYFYGWWDWRFLGLLGATTLFDYWIARLLPANRSGARRGRDRALLVASIAANLSVLGFFKYFNFFVDSAAAALSALGFQPHLTTLQIILPVGISFYTFQSMSYVIDVYRGTIPAERSLLTFALFVAFFPQLVAGPIERAAALIPQLKRPVRIDRWGLYSGAYLLAWGLFKKAVLADNVAGVADETFGMFSNAAPRGVGDGGPSGGLALIGVYAFAIQIYCDFSGYSDMARGAARMMGFELMNNFRLPYFAVNPSDFWHRWHVSLSTWLRDYLYVPLGGNRGGTARTYLNLMITMLLGGLWHGAAWTFVLWGAYHGALLCAHRAARPWLESVTWLRRGLVAPLWTGARIVLFFHLVCLGWLLFRAETVAQAAAMLGAILGGVSLVQVESALLATVLVSAAALFVVQVAQALSGRQFVGLLLPVPVRAVAYAAIILGVIVFGQVDGRAFIYFQF